MIDIQLNTTKLYGNKNRHLTAKYFYTSEGIPILSGRNNTPTIPARFSIQSEIKGIPIFVSIPTECCELE